jgi:hypothetical protein
MRPAPSADDARAIDTRNGAGRRVDVAKDVTRVRHFVGLGEEVLAAEDRGEAAVAHEADLLKVLCERAARKRLADAARTGRGRPAARGRKETTSRCQRVSQFGGVGYSLRCPS